MPKTSRLRVVAVMCLLGLLQTGCSSVRVAQESRTTEVKVNELVKSSKSWDGKLLPSYPTGQPEITIRRISIPAGARLQPHGHAVINAGLLVSGELKVVTMDGRTLQLKAGDPIIELVNTVHYGVNEGTVPADIIVVYAGVAGAPTTVGSYR